MSIPPIGFLFKNKEEAIEDMVLKPLLEAYEIVKGDITKTTPENQITKKIVLKVKKNPYILPYIDKHFIKISYRPPEVYEDETVNEPDMAFFIVGKCDFWIEAKRIYEKSTPYTYCGENGLGRFLSGYYSAKDGHAGMIAYIQEGILEDIRKDIMERVNCCSCKELTEDIEIDNSFSFIHERCVNGNIKIYHLLFDFVQH